MKWDIYFSCQFTLRSILRSSLLPLSPAPFARCSLLINKNPPSPSVPLPYWSGGAVTSLRGRWRNVFTYPSCASLLVSYWESCRRSEGEKRDSRPSREWRTDRVRSILNTSHPGRRAAHKSKSLSLSLSVDLSLSHSLSLPRTHTLTLAPAPAHALHTSPLRRSKLRHWS